MSSLLLLSVAGLQLASAVGTIDAKLASIADDIDDNLEALDTDGPPTELKDGLMVMAMARSRRRRRRRAACNCICDRGRCCRAFPQVKAALQYEGADGKKMNCCEQPFYNGGEAENFQGGCVKLLRDGPNGGAKRERFLQAMTTHKSVQEEDKEVQEDDVGESVCSCGCTEATCCRGGGAQVVLRAPRLTDHLRRATHDGSAHGVAGARKSCARVRALQGLVGGWGAEAVMVTGEKEGERGHARRQRRNLREDGRGPRRGWGSLDGRVACCCTRRRAWHGMWLEVTLYMSLLCMRVRPL